MAVDMPTVSYPGDPVTAIAGSGHPPNASVASKAGGVAADLVGVTDAKQAVKEIAEKEGVEEAGRATREGIEHFKGTPGERLYDIKSGYDGPSATRPNGTTPGMNWRVRSHVEARRVDHAQREPRPRRAVDQPRPVPRPHRLRRDAAPDASVRRQTHHPSARRRGTRL
jgi:hypothetical protein